MGVDQWWLKRLMVVARELDDEEGSLMGSDGEKKRERVRVKGREKERVKES